MYLSHSSYLSRRRAVALSLAVAAAFGVMTDTAAAGAGATVQVQSASPGQAWWTDFRDPILDALLAAALDANQDLKIAAARLAQARALVDGADAERRPRLDAVAGAQRGRAGSAEPRTERSAIGMRAAWEVDVFGQAGLAAKAARADSEAAREGLRAARIALAADVATAYFGLRTLDQRLELRREAIALAQRQLDVSSRKFEAGLATSLDKERWHGELAQEEATLAVIEGERRVRLHQLSLLLGSSGAPDLGSSVLPAAVPAPPAAALAAELLERRPDVQRQARGLDAALARVGVARRDLYPRLQLDWSGTQERLAVAGGSAAPRLVVGYGLSLSLPILDGGRIRANIKVQDARAQEAMAEYEKAMLAALVDADSSLARWGAAGRSWLEWERATAAADAAAATAQRMYEAGGNDLGAVLDARRAYLQARDALAQAAGARWEAAVGLRRAFAGAL